MTAGPRRSPLHERHLALGARMAPFAGWEMPLDYADAGVVKEHTAVRTTVGVFDVSHLGKALVHGPGAAAYVNDTLSNDLARIGPGKAQYTLCCDDASGGVVDDLIVYLRGDDRVLLVPNAANTVEVVRRLAAEAPAEVRVENQHERYATVAVQGPRSAEVLDALGLPTDHDFMSFVDVTWRDRPVVVCRSGYTGEHGYELMPTYDGAVALWDALLEAGKEHGALPCGLGARDTLRTEAGYLLHGQDLSLEVTPVQARLSWAVGWKKPRFWGHEVLRREREEGPRRRLWGIEATDRAIPRPGMAVSAAGRRVGEVTSGTFSPTRRLGIGLALLESSIGEGDEVSVDVRGKACVMRVVKPPFVRVATR